MRERHNLREPDGRFKKTRGWYISSKGYPRISHGPLRHQYLHRVLKARALGRELHKSEDVHHDNGNKLDLRDKNLVVLDHTQHGYVSALQHWYLTNILDIHLKAQWDEFFDGPAEPSVATASTCVAGGASYDAL